MTADLSQIELGPKMQACSERERQFAWHYSLNGGNGAQAARDAGCSDVAEGCKVRAHEMLHRQRVVDAIDEIGRKQFRSLLIPAITAMRTLLGKPDHPDHARTVNSALDRLGLPVRTVADVNMNHSGEVTLNHTDGALADLRMLLAMGVPREKLIETFGFSGLTRYERMLAEQNARAPKLIEGEVVGRE